MNEIKGMEDQQDISSMSEYNNWRRFQPMGKKLPTYQEWFQLYKLTKLPPKTNIIEQQKELAEKLMQKTTQPGGLSTEDIRQMITQVITNVGEELNKRFMDLNGTVYADEVVVRARDIKNLIKSVTGLE